MELRKSIIDKYFSFENLQLAWERIVRSTDRISKNRFGIRTFGNDLETNLEKLSSKLEKGEFQPRIPFKIYVPKASGMQRTKSILHIEDELVYQAIANVVAQECYEDFNENEDFIFGSILNEEVSLGIKVFEKEEPEFFFYKHYLKLYNKFAASVNKAVIEDKMTFKLETDITGFFDSIPHYNFLKILSESPFNTEDSILDLLSNCLNLWSGTRDGMTPGIGIPQGPLASSFFANAVLHQLDNEIIAQNYTYYRYMDDIRIYGYEGQNLLKALVLIDKYLKSRALSLNSKKTSIAQIKDVEKEESTIKLLDYDGDEEEADEKPKVKTSLDFQDLAEQDGNVGDITVKITNPEEIKGVWKAELKAVKKELKSWFKNDKETGLILTNEELNDGDLRNVAYRYRMALKGLENSKKSKTDIKLIPYWLFLLKKFSWKADQICWVLNFYPANETLKKSLLKLIEEFEIYEWVKHQIYSTLNVSQIFDKRELKQLFGKLKGETLYTKLALYKLLIYHASDKQFLTSVSKVIRQEANIYLKKELLAYCQLKKNDAFTIEELIETFGL